MATEQSKIYPDDPVQARVPEPQAASGGSDREREQ